mgnify:CR=1 FL=1
MFFKKLGLLGLLFLGFHLSAAPIKHRIQMPFPQSHYFDVTTTLDVSLEKGKFIDLKMAAWTPGSYLIREFAKNVEQISALSGNANLPISKISKNTWRVSFQPGTKTVQVNYQVYANELSVRTSFLDDVHGYINWGWNNKEIHNFIFPIFSNFLFYLQQDMLSFHKNLLSSYNLPPTLDDGYVHTPQHHNPFEL